MNTTHSLIAILIFASFFTACNLTQNITYPVNEITPSKAVETIPINVNVKTLADHRTHIEENMVLFTSPRETTVGLKRFCINSEKHYNKDAVVDQITQLLVKHINKAQLFANASYNTYFGSDYYLTGTLTNFYGEQEVSTDAVIGSMFGLVGALATADLTTPGIIIIEISDLKLFRKDDDTLIKDFGSFYKEYKSHFKVDAYCWCIYQNMNQKLKDFNAELIEMIRAELLNVNL